jgi:2-oxoglutarate dehydrogenase E1 component
VLAEPGHLEQAEKILFCSGKLYYELLQRQEEEKKPGMALLRLEQLYPFPEDRIESLSKKCRNAKHWCWVQEEPENMGAWGFVRHRLEAATGRAFHYIGRPAASSPATGFPAVYRRQQADILAHAIGPAPNKPGFERGDHVSRIQKQERT